MTGVKEAGLLLVADRKGAGMLVGVQLYDRGWQGKSTKFQRNAGTHKESESGLEQGQRRKS